MAHNSHQAGGVNASYRDRTQVFGRVLVIRRPKIVSVPMKCKMLLAGMQSKEGEMRMRDSIRIIAKFP